jgi:hypothetical protein
VTRATGAQPDLVVASHFVQAARDSGYLSLATALGELIDNSIQAKASKIDISITRAEEGAHPTISVTDNGIGMGRRELADCLKFGGTSRFNNRVSLGRYGMGLPAASLSQARTVSVEAWQDGNPSWRVTLCLAEAIAGNLSGLRPARTGEKARVDSGCRVTWHECDRIEYQRLGWLERALANDLGRIFRRFIQDGLILTVNRRKVIARDPLFLNPTVDSCQSVLPVEPLQYEMTGNDGRPATVTVRFSELPVAQLHDLDAVSKRRLGIVGSAGVSVLRSGREIAYGWHLMGGKRKENYDDWWRCEIEFEPTLDEEFGITHSKQGIRPSSALREALEPDLEAMARLLNGRVRQAFEAVKLSAATERSCRIAQDADGDLPVIRQGRGRHLKRGALTYQLHAGPLASGSILAVDLRDGVLHATMNTDHPAFPAIYKPLISTPTAEVEELRVGIELLVLACARTQALFESGIPRPGQSFPELWSEALGKMLRRA